jgi:hypothetical protein
VGRLGRGGLLAITHEGIVEVEEALDDPKEPTEHFPPAITINIGEMHSSQVQVGTRDSQQQGTFTAPPDHGQLLATADLLRALLPQLGLNDDDRQEAEADLATAQSQLHSSRPKMEIVRSALKSVVNILEGVSSAATRSVELTQALETLHRELPGL